MFLLIGINNESNSYFFEDLAITYLLEFMYLALEEEFGDFLSFFIAAATTSLLNGLYSLIFLLNLLIKPGNYLFVEIKDSW